jgi:hypothetical protein
VTAPVAVPDEVGAKTTLIVQLAPGATVEPQVPALPKANGPLMAIPLMVSVEPPVLVSVAASAALVCPTVVEGKLSEVGDKLAAAGEPELPVRPSVCVPKLSGRVTAPVAVPDVIGAKTTLIVQLAPGATVAAQVPTPPKANGPLMAKLPLKVRVELLVLVSVEYSTLLVEPTGVSGKLMVDGDRVTELPVEDWPVPLSVTCKALPLDGAIVNVAVSEPLVCGVKVTLMEQLAPAATDEPQLLVSAKSALAGPDIEIPESETADELLLVRVSVCEGLVWPIEVLEKPTEDGEMLNMDVPVEVPTYS